MLVANPANKFCIISVKTAEKDVPEEARSIRRRKDHLIRFVATGYELPRTDAVELELDGEWKKGKYGMQLQVEQWHEIVPQTKSGVEGYLASGLTALCTASFSDCWGKNARFPCLKTAACWNGWSSIMLRISSRIAESQILFCEH